MLLARSGSSDAVDATVVCLAADGDDILASDPGDLRGLAEAADRHIDIIPVCVRPAATVKAPTEAGERCAGMVLG
jgi:hypothetical protein